VAVPSFLSPGGPVVQEGELTVADGAEAAVRYKKAFQSPPRLVIVELRQPTWFEKKPYSKGDFLFVQQDATGFRVLNTHPEQAQRALATIKWRAEGVPAAVQPHAAPAGLAALAQQGQPAQDQLVAAIQGLGGAVGFDPPPVADAPRPVGSIDLHHTKVTDADLTHLQALARLRSLNLSGTRVGDEGMQSVGEFSALQTLLLNDTQVGDAGLQQLQRLTELRELSLYHTRVTDDGLAALGGLKNLRDLTLSGPQITDRGLAQLAGLRNLKHLYLSATDVTKAGVAELKKALPKTEIIQ
jgi:hypothetical protein